MTIKLDLEHSATRLFAAGFYANQAAHERTFGQLPVIHKQELLAELDASGLDGRGGAGFAMFRKMASTEQGTHKKPVVIANAAEGEYLSHKDRMLLLHAPHLVLDGLQVAGALVGSRNLYLYARAESLATVTPLATARGIQVLEAPGTFVSGEASAAVSALLRGSTLPMNHRQHLNRSEKVEHGFLPKTRGPALVHNVETLAHLALITRYGAQWFRSTGATGTRLFTVHHRDRKDTVSLLELADASNLEEIQRASGLDFSQAPAILVGGLQGRWVESADYTTPLSAEGINPAAGIIYPLKPHEHPVQVAAGIINYLAGESAGQCGPCFNGLPELAASFTQLLIPGKNHAQIRSEIAAISALVTDRGMCKHPDATAGFAAHTAQKFASVTQQPAQGKAPQGAARSKPIAQGIGGTYVGANN